MTVYRVVYEQFNGAAVERRSKRMERHCTLDAMRDMAAERYDGHGCKLVEVRPETAFESATHKAIRFTIRLLRIMVGAAIAFAAYVLFLAPEPSMANIPLAELTPAMITSALFRGAIFVALGSLGWLIAFGAGPSYAD